MSEIRGAQFRFAALKIRSLMTNREGRWWAAVAVATNRVAIDSPIPNGWFR